MTGPERDNDVDDWLQARRTVLRNVDDALTLEPPPELDRRVIDRARRELRTSQAEKPAFFRGSRFTMPFAIAATVVLSFSLVLEFNRYESGRDALRTHAENSSASTITLTPPLAASADVAGAQASSEASAPNLSIAPAAAALSQAKAERSERNRRQDAMADKADGNLVAAAMPGPAPPAAPSAAAPVMPAPLAAAARESEPEPAAAKASSIAQGMPARPAARAAAPAAAGSVAETANAADAPARSAAQWWRIVEQLRRAGHNSEAEAEYKALMKAYPDFVAPAEQAQPPQ